MTTLAVYNCSDAVYIGCDTRITIGDNIEQTTNIKWEQTRNNWWVASSGELKVTYFLRKAFETEFFEIDEAANTLKKFLDDFGWQVRSDSGAKNYEFTALVVSPELKVYKISCDCSVMEINSSFVAAGSGRPMATAAFHALFDTCINNLSGEVVISTCISSVCKTDTGSGSPIWVRELKKA